MTRREQPQEQDPVAKVNVRVSRGLHNDLLATVPWGLRRHLIEAVLGVILRAIKAEGLSVIGSIIAGEFELVRTPAKKPK